MRNEIMTCEPDFVDAFNNIPACDAAAHAPSWVSVYVVNLNRSDRDTDYDYRKSSYKTVQMEYIQS